MNLSNPENMVKTAVGIAGGAALIAPAAPVVVPVAMPVVHGLASVAVVGFSLFAVGSLAVKAAGALSSIGNTLKPKGGDKAVF